MKLQPAKSIEWSKENHVIFAWKLAGSENWEPYLRSQESDCGRRSEPLWPLAAFDFWLWNKNMIRHAFNAGGNNDSFRVLGLDPSAIFLDKAQTIEGVNLLFKSFLCVDPISRIRFLAGKTNKN